MPRYFVELAYSGQGLSGFQIQENANSVQAEVEKAYEILHRRKVAFTGSSRTDSGVHARQNFFHFDDEDVHEQFLYKMNALLLPQIAIRTIHKMHNEAHSRFDAVSRRYSYHLHSKKNPFLNEWSYFYPYHLDLVAMFRATEFLVGSHDFSSFSKSNSQVKNFECRVVKAAWLIDNETLVFEIISNRFLRGMVRLLTGSLLMVGRGRLDYEGFVRMFKEVRRVGFSVPARGLYLEEVKFPENFFPRSA